MAATVYWVGDPEIKKMVDEAMQKWHGDLVDAGVKIGVIMAFNDKKPAVNHGGYPSGATIKIIPLKDRISKGFDAELTLDADFWKRLTDPAKMALLDHELCHLDLKRKKVKKKKKDEDSDIEDESDELGEILYDNHNRPQLVLVKGDWNGGDGFQVVVNRHKEHSQELRNAKFVSNTIDEIINTGQDSEECQTQQPSAESIG